MFYDSICQDYPDTGRSTGEYVVFYQGEYIFHCKYVTYPVSQYSTKSEYNEAWTVGMTISHYRVLNNNFLNKDPYVVPEQAPLIISDRK